LERLCALEVDKAVQQGQRAFQEIEGPNGRVMEDFDEGKRGSFID